MCGTLNNGIHIISKQIINKNHTIYLSLHIITCSSLIITYRNLTNSEKKGIVKISKIYVFYFNLPTINV